MPLKNYTSRVPADQSINEIQKSLVAHGASGVSYEWDQKGRISALAFKLIVGGQPVYFSLPVNWRLFQVVLKEQKVREWQDEDYVYRVAWRNLRDWVAIVADCFTRGTSATSTACRRVPAQVSM